MVCGAVGDAIGAGWEGACGGDSHGTAASSLRIQRSHQRFPRARNRQKDERDGFDQQDTKKQQCQTGAERSGAIPEANLQPNRATSRAAKVAEESVVQRTS